MEHFKILKRALDITWKYRALWLVGLLLVLAGGGVMNGPGGPPPDTNSRATIQDQDWGWHRSWEDPSWEEAAPIVFAVALVVLLVFIGILLFSIIAAVVRYVTRSSLIKMVQSHEETGEEIGFWGGLRLGWSRSAFRLFLINLIINVPLIVLMLALILPILLIAILAFSTVFGPAILLGVLLILLIIPIIVLGVGIRLVLTPIQELAHRACVTEDLGPWAAIKHAFGLTRRNIGATVLQWLLLIGLGIAWTIVMIPVNLLLVFLALLAGGLPALLVGGVTAVLSGWLGLAFGVLILILATIVIVGLPNIALGTLATVFYSTAWTLTYRELSIIDAGQEDDGAQVDEAAA